MEEDIKNKLNVIDEHQFKQDQLITETLIRVAALENILVAKNLVTPEEIKNEFNKLTTQLVELTNKIISTSVEN